MTCKKLHVGNFLQEDFSRRLLQAVAVHLVVQGPHADAEQLRGPFAVVVALLEGGQDRRLLDLGDGGLQGRHLRSGQSRGCWRARIRPRVRAVVACISLGRSSRWMVGPSTVTTRRSMQFFNWRTFPGHE